MAQQVYWEQLCDVLEVKGRAWIHYQDGYKAYKEKRRKNGTLTKKKLVDIPCNSSRWKVGIAQDDAAKTNWEKHGVMSTYDFDTLELVPLLNSRGCAVESIEPAEDGPQGYRI